MVPQVAADAFHALVLPFLDGCLGRGEGDG
jgi:hypothetical protein